MPANLLAAIIVYAKAYGLEDPRLILARHFKPDPPPLWWAK